MKSSVVDGGESLNLILVSHVTHVIPSSKVIKMSRYTYGKIVGTTRDYWITLWEGQARTGLDRGGTGSLLG